MKNIEVGHVIGDLPETGDFKRPTKSFFFKITFQVWNTAKSHEKLT